MANDSNHTGTPSEFVAWLGGLLMGLVAGEDLRVRRVIALAVIRARSSHDLELKARWLGRRNLAANHRVE